MLLLFKHNTRLNVYRAVKSIFFSSKLSKYSCLFIEEDNLCQPESVFAFSVFLSNSKQEKCLRSASDAEATYKIYS